MTRPLKKEKGMTGNHKKAVLGKKWCPAVNSITHTVPKEQDSEEWAKLVHTCSLTLVEQSDWVAIKVPVKLACTSARKMSLLLSLTSQHLTHSAISQSGPVAGSVFLSKMFWSLLSGTCFVIFLPWPHFQIMVLKYWKHACLFNIQVDFQALCHMNVRWLVWPPKTVYSKAQRRSATRAEKKKRLISVRLKWMLRSHKFKRNSTQFEKAVEIIDRTPTRHNTDYE